MFKKYYHPLRVGAGVLRHGSALQLDRRDNLRDYYGHAYRFFNNLMKMADIDVHSEGTIMESPAIIIQNHVSSLDIPVIFSAWKDIKSEGARDVPIFKYIAKKELFEIPFFGRTLEKLDMIRLDRENPRQALKSLNHGIKQLKRGEYAIIYPQGSRSLDYELISENVDSDSESPRFLTGGFRMSLRNNIPIQPIVVVGQLELMPKGQNYSMAGTIYLRVLEPVYPSEFRNAKQMTEYTRKTMEDKIIEMGYLQRS